MDYNEYIKKANEIRGDIIDKVALLEMIINSTNALYYCGDSGRFIELIAIFKEIGFEKNIQIFKSIIEKHKNEITHNIDTVYAEIMEVKHLRNDFAHSILYFPGPTEQFDYNEVRLVQNTKFKNAIGAQTAEKIVRVYKINDHLKIIGGLVNLLE